MNYVSLLICAFFLTGCTHISNTDTLGKSMVHISGADRSAVQQAADARRRIYASLKPGTAVFRITRLVVNDGALQKSFSAAALVTRTPRHVTVTDEGETTLFSGRATTQLVPDAMEYYVGPGKSRPTSVKGRLPDYIIPTRQLHRP